MAAVTLTKREARFINNFVGSCDPSDRFWKMNLESDLASYRYPHTAKVRSTVNKLMKEKQEKGDFTPLQE